MFVYVCIVRLLPRRLFYLGVLKGEACLCSFSPFAIVYFSCSCWRLGTTKLHRFYTSDLMLHRFPPQIFKMSAVFVSFFLCIFSRNKVTIPPSCSPHIYTSSALLEPFQRRVIFPSVRPKSPPTHFFSVIRVEKKEYLFSLKIFIKLNLTSKHLSRRAFVYACLLPLLRVCLCVWFMFSGKRSGRRRTTSRRPRYSSSCRGRTTSGTESTSTTTAVMPTRSPWTSPSSRSTSG